MKKLPEDFLKSLSNVKGFDRESFVAVHEAGPKITSIRINPMKKIGGVLSTSNETLLQSAPTHHSPLPWSPKPCEGDTTHHTVPWAQNGFYLDTRPSFTFDPLFHAGCYYVQDASSMFIEQPFRQLLDLTQSLKVLDLCAAPGGKSTHIQSLISADSLLVSNEVIRARTNILSDNIIRWGAKNVLITNNDPGAFRRLDGYFDVMVVDAPCSGSGLFRKDNDAIDEWSLHNVQLCSQRQQRILADALPALRKGGLLVYSTCSFSEEENESISGWLAKEMDMDNIPLQLEAAWNVVATRDNCGGEGYRLYPDKIKGEGFYMSCFIKKGNTTPPRKFSVSKDKIDERDKVIIKKYINDPAIALTMDHQVYFALTPFLTQEYDKLVSILNIRYRGIGIGSVMKGKLVPHHALALSTLLADNVPFIDVSIEQAIKYLQRQDMGIPLSGTGWHLIRYQSHNLGWVNMLSNRINNYYPKELRILKQSAHSDL